MPQMQKPPGGAAVAELIDRENRRPNDSAAAVRPQVEIFVEHSAHAAVGVVQTRDRGRILLTTFAKVDGAWRPVGQQASLPTILIDSTIDALHQMRDRMARGGSK